MRRLFLLITLMLIGVAGCEWRAANSSATSRQRTDTSPPNLTQPPDYSTELLRAMPGGIPRIQLFDVYDDALQHIQLVESINVTRPMFKDGEIERVTEEKFILNVYSIAGARALNLDGTERDLQLTLQELTNQQPVLVIRPGQTIHPAIQKQFPAAIVVLELDSPRVNMPNDLIQREY